MAERYRARRAVSPASAAGSVSSTPVMNQHVPAAGRSPQRGVYLGQAAQHLLVERAGPQSAEQAVTRQPRLTPSQVGGGALHSSHNPDGDIAPPVTSAAAVDDSDSTTPSALSATRRGHSWGEGC